MTDNGLQQRIVDQGVIAFEDGLPGFEQCKSFALIEAEENAPFGTLQSTDHEDISFVLVDPFYFFADYEFELPESAVQELGIDSHEKLAIRVILTPSEELSQSTVNLVAPIAINIESRQGRQIILSNTAYSTRHHIIEATAER